MVFWQAIDRYGDERPDYSALFFPDFQSQQLTYGELKRSIASVCARLAGHGVLRGDCVAIDMKNDYWHALILIACARMGVATVSAAALSLSGVVSLNAVLQDGPPAQSPADSPRSILVDETWESLEFAAGASATGDDSGPATGDLCRIMMTSGSTGRPKGVALTYAMVEERLQSYAWAFGDSFPNHERLLCGMKLPTSLGFGFLFYILGRGGCFCSDSTDFDKIASSLEHLKIGALVTTPYTLTELVKYLDASRKTVSKLPLIMTAGSLVSPQLAKEVRERLCDELVIFYGTTETGVVASTNREGRTVGKIVAGRRVEIFDGGRSVDAGKIGRVRISAAVGPVPYYDVANWHDRVEKTYFEPGDAGMLTEHGELELLGREDGIINAGGTKTTPELIEQSLVAAPGIVDCGVVCKMDAFGIGRITAMLVLSPAFDQAQFMAYCEAKVLRDFLPNKFIVVKAIPRTNNNKIDRAALMALAN